MENIVNWLDVLHDYLVQHAKMVAEGKVSDLGRLEILSLNHFAQYLDRNYEPPIAVEVPEWKVS